MGQITCSRLVYLLIRAPRKLLCWPEIICLCGSTRFYEAFRQANLRETLAGKIVLSIGCDTKSDADLFGVEDTVALKVRLDWLHKRKIDLADTILILNVNGYIGASTKSELEYAKRLGKRILFLEEGVAA